jgi:exosortase A
MSVTRYPQSDLMNAESDRVFRIHEPISRPESGNTGWRLVLPLIVAAIAIILVIYWRTAESIVAIWWRSETFAHGFLIIPITLFLIWNKRREVTKLVPAPDVLGLVLLAGTGLLWLVASAGQAQVVRQYALVAMIPAAVTAIAGRKVVLALAFPLAFLMLGVPVGEVLIPPLMDWTADFTVTALRVSGIPVFREGNFFAIPSGNWSIVEGCSGLRYLIASITVGVLYAYLSYQRLWKRVLFVVLSVTVPIIANGLRAYMIVMIAHLSDMKLALGIDHLIYGWLFFGLVMLLLFWLGSFWRDPVTDTPGGSVDASPRAVRVSGAGVAGLAAAVVAIAATWPLYAAYLDRASEASGTPILATPAAASGWSVHTMPLTDWRPRYGGASASVFQVYYKGDLAVALYLGYYRRQRQGAELVTSTNIMVQQKHPDWANVGESRRREDLGKGPVNIRQTQLRSVGQRLLIWDWFRISGHDLSNPYFAKLLLARDKLLRRGDDAAAIILAIPYDERTDVAQETLRQFVREMLPSIEATLADAAATRH